MAQLDKHILSLAHDNPQPYRIPAPHLGGGECQDISNGSRARTRRMCKKILRLPYSVSLFVRIYSNIMGNELLLIVGFTIFSLVVTMAWVGGYLDKYQQ